MPAVAYDTHASGTKIINGVPGSGNELTASLTIAANSNRALFAFVDHVDSVGNNVMDDNSYIVSVSLDGGGGTGTFLLQATIGGASVDCYYFVAPPTGYRTASVLFDDQVNPGNDLLVTSGLGLISLYNVDQANPISESDYATGLNSPITKTLPHFITDNMLIDGTISLLSTTITATATNQTARTNQQFGTLGSILRQGTSTKPYAVGSPVMSWTEGTTSRDWAQLVVEVAAATAAANVPRRTLLGVGL